MCLIGGLPFQALVDFALLFGTRIFAAITSLFLDITFLLNRTSQCHFPSFLKLFSSPMIVKIIVRRFQEMNPEGVHLIIPYSTLPYNYLTNCRNMN